MKRLCSGLGLRRMGPILDGGRCFRSLFSFCGVIKIGLSGCGMMIYYYKYVTLCWLVCRKSVPGITVTTENNGMMYTCVFSGGT